MPEEPVKAQGIVIIGWGVVVVVRVEPLQPPLVVILKCPVLVVQVGLSGALLMVKVVAVLTRTVEQTLRQILAGAGLGLTLAVVLA